MDAKTPSVIARLEPQIIFYGLKSFFRVIKMMQHGKHALNPNVQFSPIAYSVATQMNVFLNVFNNSKQSRKTVLVRSKHFIIPFIFFCVN